MRPKKIKWQDLDENFIYFAELGNIKKDCTHSVSIYKGWIFDSNLDSAIKLTKENIDWCSTSPTEQFEMSQFTFFIALYKLRPCLQKMKKTHKL